MKKRSNKGFTLVEVILSLAIFSIISVGFLGMFSSVYINTFKSTVVTENAFLAQRQIEDQIAVVKSSLEKNTPPTGLTSSTVTLFSGSNLRNVIVYHLRQSVTTDQVIDTLVASSRPPQLLVPNITSTVTIAAFSGTTKKDYPNIGMPSLSVDLGTTLVVDNPGLLIRYLYYWYISNPGYYITNTPPAFPDNYEIIAEHTTDTIPSIPTTYGGRFLKLVVTPVGEKGQMGTSVQSNALYISGIPINDNLIFNLDASYINTSDTAQIR
jgi:prepilin-type N-terminal cleavage/methylation domain-containing protein